MISLGILTYSTTAANSFKFQILLTVNTTAGKTFTIPTNNGGAGYNHNFVANWGDGSPDSIITAYNDPDRTHVYASIGTYDITLTGLCECFSFNNVNENTSITKITKLLSFIGDMGFKKLDFYGCTALNTIVPLGSFASLTSAFNMFRTCKAISSIPSGMFDGCTLITNFSYTFCDCWALISIPANLFQYNTLVTTFIYVFTQCQLVTTIPANLFDNNTLVTSFGMAFGNCYALTSIPANLFNNNILVTDFSYLFMMNSGSELTSIPSNLFRYNTLATAFAWTFYGCIKAQYNINIFYATGEEGTRFLNKSINFMRCFYRTSFTGIQGTAPDLWNCNFGTGAPIKTTCYATTGGNNAISLSNYALIPVAWK